MIFRNLINTHPKRDVYVVGTGTSLKSFDWKFLHDKLTIALNDAILYFRPTYHLFSDDNLIHRYYKHKYSPDTTIVCQQGAMSRLKMPKRKSRVQKHVIFRRVNLFKRVGDNDDALFVNRTVATGGILLAWKFGARRIFLLGVDGYKYEKSYYLNGAMHRSPRKDFKVMEDGRRMEERHRHWVRDMAQTKDFLHGKGLYKEEFPYSGVFNLNPLSTIGSWEIVPFEHHIEALSACN